MDLIEMAKAQAIPLVEETAACKDEEHAKRAADYQREVEKFISPPGALGLPALLDKRRLEWTIPDGAFDFFPAFDFVYVYQIPLYSGDTYGGESLIVRADITKDRERAQNARGILVSAGLPALDKLRSNGFDLGHVIRFIRIAPFRQEIAVIGGKVEYVLGMQIGDIRGSEDLAKEIRQGRTKVRLHKTENGGLEHRLELENGDVWKPEVPWIPEDY